MNMMNRNTILSFEQATQQVFSEIGFSGIGSSDSENLSTGTNEFIATVGLTGQIQGFLSLGGTRASAIEFVRQMFQYMGMDEEEDNDFGQSCREALGELVNQICGRSSMLLELESINIDITPPTILVGTDLFLDVDKLEDILHKDITGEFGTFNLFVGVRSYM